MRPPLKKTKQKIKTQSICNDVFDFHPQRLEQKEEREFPMNKEHLSVLADKELQKDPSLSFKYVVNIHGPKGVSMLYVLHWV